MESFLVPNNELLDPNNANIQPNQLTNFPKDFSSCMLSHEEEITL